MYWISILEEYVPKKYEKIVWWEKEKWFDGWRRSGKWKEGNIGNCNHIKSSFWNKKNDQKDENDSEYYKK